MTWAWCSVPDLPRGKEPGWGFAKVCKFGGWPSLAAILSGIVATRSLLLLLTGNPPDESLCANMKISAKGTKENTFYFQLFSMNFCNRQRGIFTSSFCWIVAIGKARFTFQKVFPSPCNLVNACSIVDILMLDILHLQSFTMDVSYLGVYHLFRQKLKSSNVQSDDVFILKTPNNKSKTTLKENPMILISKSQRWCFNCIFNSPPRLFSCIFFLI